MMQIFQKFKESKQEQAPQAKIASIACGKIAPNRNQPRRDFDEEGLKALAESIKTHGILQPITVRRTAPSSPPCPIVSGKEAEISMVSDAVYTPGRPQKPIYEIIAGERRFRAAIMAGLGEIPCLIVACDEKTSAELAIIENIQRTDLNPFEQAAAIASLLDFETMTQEALANRLSVSQSYIANKLRLLRLTEEERGLILSNRLTERHARALLRIDDDTARREILNTVIARALTVSQTEQLIKTRFAPVAPKPKPNHAPPKDLRIFTNTLERALDTITRAGLPVERSRREAPDAIEYLIRIPK